MSELGKHFNIRHMCEREGIELADALLGNTSVTYLKLEMESTQRALQRQWPSTCVPASACNTFAGTCMSGERQYCVTVKK
jgi:hypothetical protein